MQGSKQFRAKMFVNFCLADHIPQDNFYRILKGTIDLSFIKTKTQFLYAKTGRPSIDPVVLIKYLMLTLELKKETN